MKRIVAGILAHVDAGKTTLSEALLFSSGAIDRLGRVDKRDAHLDTAALERERGITIFSKQAELSVGNSEITLIDTPGHIDFSCEAERALSVIDYAILVISAPEGVTAHTKTLWQLLEARSIPTFIFVNKTDIAIHTRRELMENLRKNLAPSLVDFSHIEAREENAAAASEELMEEFFEKGSLSQKSITDAIAERSIFPCYFGSALKMQGVLDFALDFDRFTKEKLYPETLFGAKVYKISRDESGKRLTYLKLTGGALRNKDLIKYKDKDGNTVEEKIEEIRIYSADKYKPKKEISAGTVCAVLGLTKTYVGEGLGIDVSETPVLTPVLDYKMILPEGASVYEAYTKLLALSEEDPSLALSYRERTKEIRVRLMGDIQIEVLRRVIKDRFSLDVSFGEGEILYKETIEGEVFGYGHFEPLRHYAEVHLKLEAQPRGTGIVATSECNSDFLSRNWQRLIINHIEEKRHKGVLIGAPLCDVKITVVSGKAHIKHTEGGDFRQATYRAVRQGLMKAESVLLEPTFDFKIELPLDNLGKAMMDIENMHGTADAPEIVGDTAILSGNCPVATMRSYANELRAYTRGAGRIALTVGEYAPCHNADEVIEKYAYAAELDERNTPHSVFCKNGAGFVVPWAEVEDYLDLETEERNDAEEIFEDSVPERAKAYVYRGTEEEDKELTKIFEATYGKIKKRSYSEKTENKAEGYSDKKEKTRKPKPIGDEYVFIDGYNFIFAWDELRKFSEKDFSLARDVLVRLMCDYSSFRKSKAVIVFDAYKRRGGEGSTEKYGDVTVVYTKEGETADSYIEKETKKLAERHRVRVVSSDLEEQRIILGNGALRVSTKEFAAELRQLDADIKEMIESNKK